jgi:hypothetical protein
MNHKFKLLFLKQLIITTTIVFVYGSFCYFIYEKQGTINLDEQVINLWVPFVIPWIPILLWLRPCIKLLNLKREGRRSPDFGYMMVASLATAVPTIFVALYIETSAGKLTPLYDINSIKTLPVTKYYTLKKYFIDKNHVGINYTSDISGRFSSELNLRIYIACPIYENSVNRDTGEVTKIGVISYNDSVAVKPKFDSSEPLILLNGIAINKIQLDKVPPESVDGVVVLKGNAAQALYGANARNGAIVVTTKNTNDIIDKEIKQKQILPTAWLCIKYIKTIRNHQDNEKKKELEHSFYRECLNKFNDSDLSKFTYLDRLGYNSDRSKYRNAAIKAFNGIYKETAIILEPKYGSFESRSNKDLLWIFLSLVIGFIIWALMVSIPKIDEVKLELYLNRKLVQ